jgi:hypothetical protein
MAWKQVHQASWIYEVLRIKSCSRLENEHPQLFTVKRTCSFPYPGKKAASPRIARRLSLFRIIQR